MNTPTPAADTPAWLRALAAGLAEALPRLHGEAADPLLAQLIEALCAALQRGDLDLLLAGPAPAGVEAEGWPARHQRLLAASALCQEPHGPLVLWDGDPPRLSWRRWHGQRQAVLEALLERARQPALFADELAAEPADQAGLDAGQRAAVAAVLRQRLVLLEGGPGTGKTSTVAAMLRAVRRVSPEARLHLAAPTGKAAARLRAAAGALELGAIPCGTLHRLLESRGEHFARNRRHPLDLDLLVIDEVSMVDVALMAATLDALPPGCSLVLVGDPCQLPPVSPGPVLHDLQRPALRAGLGPALHTLSTTYRNAGAIAAVASALRRRIEAGGGDSLAQLLARELRALPDGANLRWCPAPATGLPAALIERLERQRQRLAQLAARCGAAAADPAPGQGPEAAELELLRQLQALLVLTPLRRGRWGVEGLHRRLLGEAAAAPLARWPLGTPVLCTRNLPECGLANGDLGVLIRCRDGEPRVLFPPLADDRPLRLHPAQLAGAAEPALALTVHKAQGSEAEEVHVLLPPGEEADPRLLYTALTRARQRAVLHGVPEPGAAAPGPAD